jgi:hypothetical protein
MGMMNMSQYPAVENISMLGSPVETFQMMPWTNNSTSVSCGSSTSSLSGCSGASGSSKPNSSNDRTPYPKSFVPTIDHVICGRGKKSYGHCGNKNFLTIVAAHIDDYAAANTKQEKSDIVQSIVDILESRGGFIRMETKTGLYYKAEDGAGREKTSQALRDCLNHKYKSSKDIKRKNRKQKRLAKQAVHEHVSEKGPSVTLSAATKTSDASACAFPDLPPLQIGSSGPTRAVSCTGFDMAAAAAAIRNPMPVSPMPLFNEWNAYQESDGQIHLIHELEPLPFQAEEVEKLPEGMGPFDLLF